MKKYMQSHMSYLLSALQNYFTKTLKSPMNTTYFNDFYKDFCYEFKMSSVSKQDTYICSLKKRPRQDSNLRHQV